MTKPVGRSEPYLSATWLAPFTDGPVEPIEDGVPVEKRLPLRACLVAAFKQITRVLPARSG